MTKEEINEARLLLKDIFGSLSDAGARLGHSPVDVNAVRAAAPRAIDTLCDLAIKGICAEATRDGILEECAGQTRMRWLRDGTYIWAITDDELRAMKDKQPEPECDCGHDAIRSSGPYAGGSHAPSCATQQDCSTSAREGT